MHFLFLTRFTKIFIYSGFHCGADAESSIQGSNSITGLQTLFILVYFSVIFQRCFDPLSANCHRLIARFLQVTLMFNIFLLRPLNA